MPRLFSPADLSGILEKPAKRPSARAMALAADLKCLCYLARFGHLTTAALGAAIWSNLKYGQDMAARTMRRLSASGVELVASRQNASGGRSWILTRRGVAFLEVRGIAAHHGMDLASISGSTFFHHSLCSRLLIEKERAGFRVWHEYAIAQGHAPLSQRQLIEGYGKLPDAILTADNRLYLLELENAPKQTEILQLACGAALKVGRRLHPDCQLELAGLIFAYNAEQSGHAVRIARAARARWSEYGAAEQARLARHVELVKIQLALPLVWLGYKAAPLAL
jgi:hypothetical protein